MGSRFYRACRSTRRKPVAGARAKTAATRLRCCLAGSSCTISMSRPEAILQIQTRTRNLPINYSFSTNLPGGSPPSVAMAAVGDLNIAPLEADVWSHKQLLTVVSHTPVEVERLDRLQQAGGFVDAVRHFVPPSERLYTWWSYRARDWAASNRGRRLDHI